MNKTINPRIRSFYHDTNEIPELAIVPEKTALLIMDMQDSNIRNMQIGMTGEDGEKHYSRWKDFYDRMTYITLPANKEILAKAREVGIKVVYAMEGNQMEGDKIIDELKPVEGEEVILRDRSSITRGTTFVDDMKAAGIDTIIVTGIATDHCVSSSVRALSDYDFNVIVVDEACSADSMESHDYELKAINICYCTVLSQMQLMEIIG
ncbi:MAG: cysteine hydrolase [Clostridiales bacterium]|nr:cysteine hydrolase [Candidatus Crickella merdequi]